MQQNKSYQLGNDNIEQWVEVYSAANAVEANILKGLLESSSIQCQLQGDMLQGALGEIPLDQGMVKIRVYAIKQRQAREILINYEQQKVTHDWQCPNCQELNGPTFEICWSCRTEKDD